MASPLFVGISETRQLEQKCVWPGALRRYAAMGDGIVRAFVRILYGVENYRVPHGVRTVDQLIMASNHGPFEAFKAALEDLTAPMRKDIAEVVQKIAEVEKEEMDADAARVERRAAFARYVPKLSEMTGFGEARSWGLNLARDLRDYVRGDFP